MELAYDVIHPSGDRQIHLPPVVMLHGMIDSRQTWKQIAHNISMGTGRIVYIVDARNHGASPRSKEMNWDVLADDIGHFLKQHNIRKAVLVGHSMGGRAAFTFALKRPEMVEKLVVEDIDVLPLNQKHGMMIISLVDFLKDCLKEIPAGADEVAAKKALVDYITSCFTPSQMESLSFLKYDIFPLKRDGDKFVWQVNLEAIENFARAENMTHDVSKLGIYVGDAMFVFGAKSFFKKKNGLLKNLFPRSMESIFDDGHHLLHHQFPRKFEKLVIDFINNGLIYKSKV